MCCVARLLHNELCLTMPARSPPSPLLQRGSFREDREHRPASGAGEDHPPRRCGLLCAVVCFGWKEAQMGG